ncbi:helix-turn-helix domain-containing protein [Metaclostridioides mangenotii]|uniref:helix-turn-helix domain-containing protein n=1 Tax=Metaclostridioides mangenotii TaxID=1540 RepID=UPI0026ED825A|nr:helix-turn-helix transcriptional regulator [Clostridioides mangenotii]
MTIGDKINQLLKLRNMKAYILAEKIETDSSNLYRIIRNENTNPTIKIVKKIADAFEVSVDELVCDIDVCEGTRK